jgi:hypothetical protein
MRDFKKEYITMRNEKRYEIEFFYDYYLSKGGKVVDPNEFTEKFVFTHIEQPTIPGYPKVVMRTGEIDRQEVLNFLDGEFRLTILNDRIGNFLKIVE